MSDRPITDSPVSGRLAASYSELWSIVTHPAFRLGFRDAQAGRSIDHDDIMGRIASETPDRALKRLGFGVGPTPILFPLDGGSRTELAQVRYEEGRLAHIQAGLWCRDWRHPDFPPAQVRDYVQRRARAAVMAPIEGVDQ